MEISYAIVTHNNGEAVIKTIKSLVKYTPSEYVYTIYIIDNLSTDDTLKKIKNVEGNIEIIEPGSNLGFGYGHNKVLNRINSKYHFVVNPDIVIDDCDTIREMVLFLEKNDTVGMLVPKILNFDNTIQYLNKRNPTVFDMLIRFLSPNIFKRRQDYYVMKDVGYDKKTNLDYASGCFMCFRTVIFKTIEGFDTTFFMYLEDADITRRINEISNSVYYPNVYVYHDWARAGHKKIKFIFITLKSMRIYFKKWGWKFI